MTEKKDATDSVVPKAKASTDKWSKPVMAQGFLILPSLLLKAQARLKLKPIELALIFHLADFWWDSERKPFPSKKRLGERLGIGGRQVQRWLANLEEAGLISRKQRYAPSGGKLTNEYDLSGLVKRLKELEPEFREADEAAKAIRQKVQRPGMKPKAAASK
jgi:predicted transcriptional regulator